MKVNPTNMLKAHDELLAIFEKKNADYGNSFEESLEKHGIIAAIVRMEDKMGRLNSLTKPGSKQKVSDESLVDTLKDLSNYALMTAVWLEEEKLIKAKPAQPHISEWANLSPDGANLKQIILDLKEAHPGFILENTLLLDNWDFPKSLMFTLTTDKVPIFRMWFREYCNELPYYNALYHDLRDGYVQVRIYSHTEGYTAED